MSARGIMSHYGAKGDGVTDDTEAFLRALGRGGTPGDETLTELVLERTPNDAGYALDMTGSAWSPLTLKAGLKVRGEGAGSKLVRTGEFSPSEFMFRNRDQVNGDDGIEFHGVHLDGRWRFEDPDVAWVGPGNPNMTFLQVRSSWTKSQRLLKGFVMVGCRSFDWPGVYLFAANHEASFISDHVIDRNSGGGLIFRYRNKAVQILNSKVLRACDDTIAFNGKTEAAAEAEEGPSTGCFVRDCRLSRFNPPGDKNVAFGPVLSIRGANDLEIRRTDILHGPGEGVALKEWYGMPVKNLRMHNVRVRDTADHQVHVQGHVEGSATILDADPSKVVNKTTSSFPIEYGDFVPA